MDVPTPISGEVKDVEAGGGTWRCGQCSFDNTGKGSGTDAEPACDMCATKRGAGAGAGAADNSSEGSSPRSKTVLVSPGVPPHGAAKHGAGGVSGNSPTPKQLAPARLHRGQPGCCASVIDWMNPFVGDRYELRKSHICAWIVVVVVVIIAAPMLAESFEMVMFDQYGIGYSTISGETDTEVTGAGRHFVGLARDFHRLPNQISTIDFSHSGGTAPMSLRVKNGQQIEVDISFQFVLPADKVIALYKDFKFTYVSNFRKTAESSFRLVAANYHAEEFFHNRSIIEADMLNTLESKISERNAQLIGLQVRKIDLPDAFESRLVEIELKKQDAQKATEEILLAQINAETQKQLRELRAAKDKLMIELNQETENLRLLILQNQTEIEEGTSRVIARMTAELEEFIVLFEQQTENMELEVLHNKTIIEQTTSAEVAEMDARTAEHLNLFNQETKNLELAILQNKTVEEARTVQQVAAIEAEQAAFIELFKQGTRNQVAQLDANTTQTLEATAAAALAVSTAEDLVVASTTATVDQLLAEAVADAARLVAQAGVTAAENRATSLAHVQQTMSTTLSAEGQLLHEWIAAFEATSAGDKNGAVRFMDMATPTALAFNATMYDG